MILGMSVTLDQLLDAADTRDLASMHAALDNAADAHDNAADAHGTMNGWSLIHVAAQAGFLPGVEAAIEAGVDASLPGARQRLHSAAPRHREDREPSARLQGHSHAGR